MEIIWDEVKNETLRLQRGIGFEEIADIIFNEGYLDILENPTRAEQLYFILAVRDYTWVVPFLIDEEDRIVLKTAFPSRKYHKIYGGESSE